MTLPFYLSITEDEKKICNVKEDTLKVAAKDVTSAYSPKSLIEGSTFCDYNIPRNRCAYLYKYAAIHTGLVSKYFKEMLDFTPAKLALDIKKEIKICCLGGGPGTDIVGIFKALATYPSFCHKVTQVTVLDLCGGWRNSFKHIVSRLKHGKVEGVPTSFINSSNFKADLIAVNLLQPLPTNIVKVISNADIICMVKFVSAIMGKQESVNALQVIANHIKLGASVLFIDNVYDKVYVPVGKICLQCGLSSVLGPLHGTYQLKQTQIKKDIYGCLPCYKTKVFVIGWIKTVSLQMNLNIENPDPVNNIAEEDDGWNTESDSDDDISPNTILKESKSGSNKELSFPKTICDKFTQTESKSGSNKELAFPKTICDKFTQTQSKSGSNKELSFPKTVCDKFTQTENYPSTSNVSVDHSFEESEISDICTLMEALNDLLVAMENYEIFKNSRNCHCTLSHCCM